MKYLVLLLLCSCAQKYQTFHVIKKDQFDLRNPTTPIAPRVRLGKKEVQQTCEGQFFFNRNAQKIAEGSIPAMLRYSCPGERFLYNAKVTERWWTTLIYSRACIKIESYCPMK